MKKIDLSRTPAVLETVDTLLGAIPWTKNRAVIVYLREHGGRRYIRLRTFNRHREKGYWYPNKWGYTVPIRIAPALGNAIVAAGEGRPFGEPPEWYAGFEKQYKARAWRKDGQTEK